MIGKEKKENPRNQPEGHNQNPVLRAWGQHGAGGDKSREGGV